MRFTKYHGLGNDFILLDYRHISGNHLDKLPNNKWVRNVCTRRFGIGADGGVVLLPSASTGDIAMRIFNSDGTEAEMCGNGIRCLVKYILDTSHDISKM